MPRKKPEIKPKNDRKDWRNLPTASWNTTTFHAYFAEMNRDRFGVEIYVPLRNWGFEQRQIKAAIERYGAEVVREVCDQAFAEYRPTRDYPQLTAGFVLSYMASRILPRALAEKEARERLASSTCPTLDVEEVVTWL